LYAGLIPIKTIEIDFEKALEIVWEYKICAYDGKSYRIGPINDDKKEKSPLEDVPYITADITTQEIVDLVRESRTGV